MAVSMKRGHYLHVLSLYQVILQSNSVEAESKLANKEELFFFSLLFVVSVAIGVAIGNLSGLDASVGTFSLVIYGFIAFSFLLIPGISGSAFLLAIGIYPLIIGSVADLNLLVLLPFATGMLFSLITMPKLIEKLLSKFDKNIYMIFAGFILGAGSSII